MKLWNKFKPYLLLAAAAAVIILPRLPRLGFYTTADEPLYLKTSASFYHTVKNGNYEQSPKGFHPGVTALWAGYGGFEVGYPDLVDRPKADIGDTGLIFTLLRKGTSVVEVLAYARLWMILGQTAVLLAGLWLLVRLVGFPAAVMGYLLLSFDPFFFGHSRILGVDGLMANLMLAAALAAANYWKQSQLRYAALAGVFTGLAALTKTPGLAMAGYFGGALAVIYLASVKRNRASFSLPGVWRQVLLPFGLFSAAALLVMYALWPAMWYDPRQLWQLLVFSIESIGGGHSTATYFNGKIVQTGNFGLEYWYFYPVIFLWRTTPVVLAGLVGWAAARLKKHDGGPLKDGRAGYTALAAYAVFYLVLVTLAAKKFDRYLLPMILPVALLSAGGWVWIGEQVREKWGNGLRIAILAAAAGLQILSTAGTFPYYLTYYNPLMGGGEKAPDVMMIGWGEGLDEAARYLNQIEGITEKKVYTWYPHIFDYYFFRKVNTRSNNFHITGVLDEEQYADFISADYAVFYVHQWQRGMSPRASAYLAGQTPVHTVWINGIEYVRIYDLAAMRGE